MTLHRAFPALLLALLLPPGTAGGPDPAASPDPTPAAEEEGDAEAGETKESAITERMTITATRVQQKVENAPAPLTVLTTEEIADTAAAGYADVLRRIPGVNVVQFGARDVNITTRSATSSLSAGQLVLVDNRTIYQDFFGFVMWDFLPVDFDQVKQIEAVRGPGSAVWGANALNGVVNIITKGPADLRGGSFVIGSGERSTRYGSVTWGNVYGPWGVRLAGSYYEQDAFGRPEGTLPSGVVLPSFRDPGTEQPKLDALVEYDLGERAGDLSFGLGAARTSGLINTGIGPFDIDPDTSFDYFKGEWSRGPYRLTLFVNDLDGDALNLLNGIDFSFETTTWNLDFVGNNAFGESFLLVYGVNGRNNDFDLSIAPREDQREEYGAFAQGEWILDKWRFTLGARVDRYPDTIGTAVSPRGAVLYEVKPGQNLRLSYAEAFRSPSLINNFLDTSIDTTIDVGPICDGLGPARFLVPACAAVPPGSPVPFTFTTAATGNEDLDEEQLRQLDLGYIGSWRTWTLTVSLFYSETEDIIDFFPSRYYSESSGNVPAGWPFPSPPFPPFLDILAGMGSGLPSDFTYRNVAKIEDKGVDLTLDWRFRPAYSLFAGYAYQDEPEITDAEGDFAVNRQPENRASLGIARHGERIGWGLSASYVDTAFWSDVLDSRFWGETDSYWLVNGSLSFGLVPDRVILTFKGNNLADDDIQQHIFGDIIDRRLIAELRCRF